MNRQGTAAFDECRAAVYRYGASGMPRLNAPPWRIWWHRIEPGDRIIQQAITALELDVYGLSLIKNNIDHETDATFGSHENYLVSRQFPFLQARAWAAGHAF